MEGDSAAKASYRELWDEYESPGFARRLEEMSRALGLEFDARRPPFLFAGNAEDPRPSRLATFGLAPHSHSEAAHTGFEGYYEWRLRYFDRPRMPHRIHGYFWRILRGLLDSPLPPEGEESRWLHENGYLTFDMIPYYVREWRTPDWASARFLDLVREHLRRCFAVLAGFDVVVAIFSGKAWLDFWVEDPRRAEPYAFCRETSFALSEVTGRDHCRGCPIHLGTIRGGGAAIPSIAIGHLLHQIRGLSHEDARRLGAAIRERWTERAPIAPPP